MSSTETETQAAVPTPPQPDLPPLSALDFRAYNRLAEHMDYFHNHFRSSWNSLYQTCEANKRSGGQSIRSFINSGLQFCHQLTFHHDIEEEHVFPVLGRKMPAFRNKDELKGQHRQIHAGLDRMMEYLQECDSGERELRLSELKEIMDSFGGILWQHMDEEVQTLGAENMRKFWTKDEMSRLRL